MVQTFLYLFIYFTDFPIDLALERVMIISEQWCDYF